MRMPFWCQPAETLRKCIIHKRLSSATLSSGYSLPRFTDLILHLTRRILLQVSSEAPYAVEGSAGTYNVVCDEPNRSLDIELHGRRCGLLLSMLALARGFCLLDLVKILANALQLLGYGMVRRGSPSVGQFAKTNRGCALLAISAPSSPDRLASWRDRQKIVASAA